MTARIPYSDTLRAAASAAIWAANGVPLRDPLKPTAPALDQPTTKPCGSVIVTIVLLKVACTWAIPSGTLRRVRRRRGAAGAAAAPAAAAAAPAAASGAAGVSAARGCCAARVSLFSSAIQFPAFTVCLAPARLLVWRLLL